MAFEFQPFYRRSPDEVSAFLNELKKLIGSGMYFSNIEYCGGISGNISKFFPSDKGYLVETGIAIITSEWFVFFAHGGIL